MAYGWLVMGLCVVSGVIIKIVVNAKAKKGFTEDTRSWDEISDDAEEVA